MKRDECPLCGDDRRTVAYRKEPLKTTWYRCEGCTLVYKRTEEEGAETDEGYYRTGQMRETILNRQGDPESSSPAGFFEEKYPLQWARFEKTKALCTPESSVLEIGCGAGGYLHLVAPLVQDCAGVELDGEMVEFCRSRLQLNIYDQLLEEIDFGPKRFDLICLFHVLEHVAEPIPFLAQLKTLLKPGGSLAIEVPCYHEMMLQVLDLKRYPEQFFIIHHDLFFTPQTLSRLLAESGFRCHLAPFNEYGLANHLNWIQNDRPVPGASRQAGRCFQITSYQESKKNTAFVDRLNHWLRQTNAEYKALLAAHDFFDTIFCIAEAVER